MKGNTGFTLIEIIGVLIIIAILATAIVPSLSGEVTRAYADAETQSQESIGDALADYAKATHRILVASAGWPDSLVGYLDMPAAEISGTRGMGGTRRLIADPAHGLPLVAGIYNQVNAFSATSSASGNLPVAKPMHVRFLLISGLRAPAPTTAVSAADFNAIWDQTAAAPAAFVETEFLRVGRVSLASMFHAVAFTVVASAVTMALPEKNRVFFAWHRLPYLGAQWDWLASGLVDPFSGGWMQTFAAAESWECPANSNPSRTACRNYYGPSNLNVSGGATANCRVNNALGIHECTCTSGIACWQLVPPVSSSSGVPAGSAGGSGAGVSSSAIVWGTPAWNLGGMALSTAKNLPAGSFTVYLLEGTLVNLLHNGAIVGAYVVNGPRSFVYDGTRWSE